MAPDECGISSPVESCCAEWSIACLPAEVLPDGAERDELIALVNCGVHVRVLQPCTPGGACFLELENFRRNTDGNLVHVLIRAELAAFMENPEVFSSVCLSSAATPLTQAVGIAFERLILNEVDEVSVGQEVHDEY